LAIAGKEDYHAYCRGFDAQTIGSRELMQHVFFSEQGVRAVFASLADLEILGLHLLNCLGDEVELEFFKRLYPGTEARRFEYAAQPRQKFRVASENPEKLKVVRRLLERHADTPTLIIGMYIEQVENLAGELGIPILTGSTPQARREPGPLLFPRVPRHGRTGIRHLEPGERRGGTASRASLIGDNQMYPHRQSCHGVFACNHFSAFYAFYAVKNPPIIFTTKNAKNA
jgi:hypothetical protein